MEWMDDLIVQTMLTMRQFQGFGPTGFITLAPTGEWSKKTKSNL